MSDALSIKSLLRDGDAERFRGLGLWRDRTLAELVDGHAEATPDKIAVVDARVRWTYQELGEKSSRLANALIGLGVGPGVVVAVQLPTCGLLPLVHLACNRIGALFVPLSTGWGRVEVGSLLASARAKVLISVTTYGDTDLSAMHDEIRQTLPALEHVVIARAESADLAALAPVTSSLEVLIEKSDPLPSAIAKTLRPSPDDPAHVMVSSGTTGLPKASVWGGNDVATMLLTHTADALALTSDDIAGALAPANLGSTGYVFPVLAPLLVGATTAILESWSPRNAVELLVQEGCTYATAIPTQLHMLLDLPLEEADLSRLTRVNNAGAPLPPQVAELVELRMGCRVQTIYGASDGGVPVMTSIDDPAEKRRTTVGRPLIGEDVQLRTADGQLAPAGLPGEVCWRGANKSYGYLNQPDNDSAAFDADGWFCSGDLGQLDSEGYLRIVGRSKDMILRGGANIYPVEIETMLQDHPDVAEVIVVGVPDARLGERTCAVVRPHADVMLTLDRLTGFLAERGLAKFKHPEMLVTIDEFPRNAGGKVDKAEVRKYAARGTESAT